MRVGLPSDWVVKEPLHHTEWRERCSAKTASWAPIPNYFRIDWIQSNHHSGFSHPRVPIGNVEFPCKLIVTIAFQHFNTPDWVIGSRYQARYFKYFHHRYINNATLFNCIDVGLLLDSLRIVCFAVYVIKTFV